jgi:hypothetical protein
VDKVDIEQQLVAAVLPALHTSTIVAGVVPPSVVPLASRPLQILHCLWRC